MDNGRRCIRFDWAAKRLLRDKANFVVLEGLISVLLNENVKIQEILESEGNADQVDSKFNRVDIMAKNHKGELIIIEIQLSRQVHYLERILFGVGKAISDHISKGQDYSNVKKVYSISILYFDFGTGSDYVYRGQTVFKGIHTGDEFTLNERERRQLGMRAPEEVFPEYYLIRVNEFNKVAVTPLEEWIEYLKEGTVKPDTTVPGLKEARERLDVMCMSEEERRAYYRYLDNVRNEEETIQSAKIEGRAEGFVEGREEGIALGLEKGREEGLQKGREEGLQKGREEGELQKAQDIARKMRAANMDLASIVFLTGLSEDEIRQL